MSLACQMSKFSFFGWRGGCPAIKTNQKPGFSRLRDTSPTPTLSSRPEQIIAKAMICGVEGPFVLNPSYNIEGEFSRLEAAQKNQ